MKSQKTYKVRVHFEGYRDYIVEAHSFEDAEDIACEKCDPFGEYSEIWCDVDDIGDAFADQLEGLEPSVRYGYL